MPFDPSLPNGGHSIGLPPLPPYTPNPETASIRTFHSSAPSYSSSAPPSYSPRPGSAPFSRPAEAEPTLSFFRRPSGSLSSVHAHSNPQARHYHSIAARRSQQTSERDQKDLLAHGAQSNPIKAVKTLVQVRETEEFGCEIQGVGGKRLRPLEDPELVGEDAAERARKDRLRREGDEVLLREDKRWDWLLSQMDDWSAREKSWRVFRERQEKKRMDRLGEVFAKKTSQLGRPLSRA